MVDLSTVGKIEYSWDFDEEEYQEWLNDEELTDNEEARAEYINDNVSFELIFLDNETYHQFDSEYTSYEGIEDNYGEKLAKIILKDCIEDGEGGYEIAFLYDDEEIDINDPKQLNDRALKLLQHGPYYKDCRGFILTDGNVVYTPAEHNMCTVIDGIKGTFHFISLGNIRVLQNSIDIGKEPTEEQYNILRKVIATYSDSVLYLDIITNGSEYGTTYNNPDWRRVINEIKRYYREGIKPQGNMPNESKRNNIIISEEQYNRLFNCK